MPDSEQQQPPTFYSASKKWQFMAAAAATFGAFGLGTCLAWSSPALPDLEDSTNFDGRNKTNKSWIGAIITLGALISGPVTGFMIGKFGRKPTMLLMSAPFVAGWLLIIFHQNLAILLLGRFITGFCGGSFSLSSPVYIGEIAEGSVRGILGSGFQMMVVLGILFIYCMGALVEWQWLSVMCGVIPIIFLALMIFMPESPRYLIQVGKKDEALKSLAKFRGASNPVDVEPELQSIEQSVEEQMRNQASFKDLLQPSLLKPVLLSLGTMLFQQLSGINAVIFYVEQIFKDAGSDLSPELSAIIVGIVQVIATMASMVLVDRLGRKILLIFSDALMGISLVALGVFFLIKDNQTVEPGEGITTTMTPDIVTSFGWLPLVSLLSFVTAFSIGFGPIPWMLLGEILPSRAIGLASSISASFNWTLAFLVTMFFETIKDALTIQWCYFSFAIICGVGTLYVLFIVPETKGKSLDEIQAMFGESENILRPNKSLAEGGRTNPAFEKEP